MDHEVARSQLEAERTRLEGVRATIHSEHLDEESEEESFSELSHNDQHPADVGSEAFEREKDLSILQQVEHELVDVERALRRLEDGSYGRCEVCNEDIGDERLEAMPATRFCLHHQREAEGGYELRAGSI